MNDEIKRAVECYAAQIEAYKTQADFLAGEVVKRLHAEAEDFKQKIDAAHKENLNGN